MNKLSKKTANKIRKQYKEKILSISETLHNQANEKNQFDCKPILEELDDASLNGEYAKTIKLNINQSKYIASLGLKVEETDKFGLYTISW
jgi:hypothetical protein